MNNLQKEIEKYKKAGLSPDQILKLIATSEETSDNIKESTVDFDTNGKEISKKSLPNVSEVFIFKLNKKTGEFEPTRLNYNFVAKYIIKNNDFIYVLPSERDKKGFYYKYENGFYKIISEGLIECSIKEFLENYGDSAVTPDNINKVKSLMVSELIPYHSAIMNDFNKDENIINFQNGILKLDTMKLVPHDKKYLCTIQIPCNWNPDAINTPVFDRYMADFTHNRTVEDKESVRKCILEFLGLIISNIPGYRFKKGCALLLWGPGHTGKSQLRNFATAMIGEENSAVTELAELETREGPAKGYGRRLLGSGDMGFGTASQIATFKNITGGDPVTVRYMYVEGFTAKLDGVFMYCSNELPKFGGDQGAHVYDRILPIRADYVIPEEGRDPLILNKMLNEKEGIIYKSVLALKEAIAAGYKHTIPECAKEDLNTYKSENNMVIEFLESCCITEIEADGADGIKMIPVVRSEYSQAEIRKTFTSWAKANYNSIPNKRVFEKSIAEVLNISECDLIYRTSDKRGYTGFDITDEAFNNWYKA